MDFKGLTIFTTIYEVKSINKAADILGFRQSNITTHLKKIEYECGTALFIRNYNGVIPTKEGEIFYSFAIRTLSEWSEVKRQFLHQKPKLLTSELLFLFVLQKDKEILLSTEIINKKTSDIEHELHHHYYSSVITFNKLNHIHYTLIKKSSLNVCMLKNSQIKNTKNLPILVNRDASCPLRELSLQLYQETRTIIEVDTLSNILSLVKEGSAIALLPESLAVNELSVSDSNIYTLMYYEYRNTSS